MIFSESSRFRPTAIPLPVRSLSRRAAFDGDRETLRANLPETTLRFFVDIDDYAKAQSREE